uniref:Organ specific protein n=1 Tax=Mesocestoides corti TaxID=53468 RepID=A0A5K3EY70_MESCO
RALKNQKSFHVSRKAEPLDGFLNTEERFNKFGEGIAHDESIPGPGAYCIRRDPRPKPGSIVRTEERFKSMDNSLPGPADYKVSPNV